MKNELILTSSEVEDLAVCVDCGLQECMDCPRNKAKQKLKEAARDKVDVSNGIVQTVDVVQVVRCRECKNFRHYGKTSLFINGKSIKAGWCQRRISYDEEYRMTADDFCSYGELKEGTNDGIYK